MAGRHIMVLLAALTLIFGASLFASCGAGDDEIESEGSEEAQISLEDWAARYDALCLETYEDMEAMMTAEPEMPSEVLAFAEQILPLAEDYDSALRDLPPPAERPEEVRRLIELNEQGTRELRELVEAGRRADGAEFLRLLEEVFAESYELTTLERELGATECAALGEDETLADAEERASLAENGTISFERRLESDNAPEVDRIEDIVDIYAINPDGSGETNLTDVFGADLQPAYSPDGTKIAFFSDREGTADLYVMNADGTDPRQLTMRLAVDREPTWSPDGQTIAFASDARGPFQIYLLDLDGGTPVPLTEGQGISPDWSPDGSVIAYTGPGGGESEIYVIDSNGQNERRLTNNTAGDRWPDWSPDGTRIAFASSRDTDDDTGEIYVMNADGSDPVRLTRNDANDIHPSWSPDGTKIVYSSSRGTDVSHIWVMNSDGSEPRQLTAGAASDTRPDWQPVFPDDVRIAQPPLDEEPTEPALPVPPPGEPDLTRLVLAPDDLGEDHIVFMEGYTDSEWAVASYERWMQSQVKLEGPFDRTVSSSVQLFETELDASVVTVVFQNSCESPAEVARVIDGIFNEMLLEFERLFGFNFGASCREVELLDVSGIGDRAVGVRSFVELTHEGIPISDANIEAVLVAFQVGRTLNLVTWAGSEGEADLDLILELARRQAERVETGLVSSV